MRVCLVVTLAVLGFVASPTATPAGSSKAFLSAAFNLSALEIGRLDRGEVISRTLGASDRREIATLGIIRINTSPVKYVERLADIASFKRTDDVLQIGTFGHVPQAGDMTSLSIDEADLTELRACRIENCDLRMSAEGIERVEREIDWRSADASRKASLLVRRVLADYVAQYVRSGTPATMEYANHAPRLNVGREFESLMRADTITSHYTPQLRRHLLDYPASTAEKMSDFVYWSKELIRDRPVVSITHVATHAVDNSPIEYAIASKQIYAMHYFDASLGLTLLVPDRSSPSPAMYVVYLNRSRIDVFDGVFGGIVRRVVVGRARGVVAHQLQRLQKMLAAG
jgi:hypothetical protein